MISAGKGVNVNRHLEAIPSLGIFTARGRLDDDVPFARTVIKLIADHPQALDIPGCQGDTEVTDRGFFVCTML
jgi:hypothetical protein